MINGIEIGYGFEVFEKIFKRTHNARKLLNQIEIITFYPETS